MRTLSKIYNKTYQFIDGNHTYTGTGKFVCMCMAEQGIPWRDIEDAFVSLIIHNNKEATFGVFGSFMF